MFERLWEEDSKIQKYLADKRAEGISEGIALGKAEGKAEGEVRGLQEAVMMLIQIRFPTIAESVLHIVEQVNSLGELKRLFKLVAKAPNEATALWILKAHSD